MIDDLRMQTIFTIRPPPIESQNVDTHHQPPATPQHPSVSSNKFYDVSSPILMMISLLHIESSNIDTHRQPPTTPHYLNPSSNMWVFVQLIITDIRNPGSKHGETWVK